MKKFPGTKKLKYYKLYKPMSSIDKNSNKLSVT